MKTVKVVALTACLALGIAPTLDAQGPIVVRKTATRESSWTVIRVAKWALLGGAVGLGAYALHNSRIAEEAYSDLRDRCIADGNNCRMVNGRYQDAGTENLFQRSTSADRRAQVGIYGGQVAALGSVALFIYDLRNGQGPSDIPYPSRRRVGVGTRVRF